MAFRESQAMQGVTLSIGEGCWRGLDYTLKHYRLFLGIHLPDTEHRRDGNIEEFIRKYHI